MVAPVRVLRRPRLARDVDGILRAKGCRRCAVLRDVPEALLHERDDLRAHIEPADALGLYRLDRIAVRAYDALHKMRLIAVTVRCNRPHDGGRLQRRHKVESLPDRRIEGLRQIPIVFVDLLLVLAARHETFGLVGQIDARLRADAEHARILAETVDAEAIAHLVEVDVVRVGERLNEIDRAERFAARVSLRNDPMTSRVVDDLIRRDDIFLQCGSARDDLEGRSWRVLARDRLVVHRMIRVLVDNLPILRRYAVDEEVRIEGRTAHESEHLARLRIHDDRRRRVGADGGKLLIDGAFGGDLDRRIDREDEVVARDRLFRAEVVHGLARNIDLDLPAAVRAAHRLVVDALQAKLADDVARLVAFRLALFQLLVADLADVTEDMRPPRLVDVIADRLRLDHDARVLVALFLDDRIDLRADVLLDAYGIEADMRVDLLVDLFRRHMKEHGQSLDDILGNRTRQWQERHGEARAVHDEGRAVAVEEIAARRDARDDADAVAVRKARIIVAVVDLEIDEPQQKHNDDGDDDAAEHMHAPCILVFIFFQRYISPFRQEDAPQGALIFSLRGAAPRPLLSPPQPRLHAARRAIDGIGEKNVPAKRRKKCLDNIEQTEAVAEKQHENEHKEIVRGRRPHRRHRRQEHGILEHVARKCARGIADDRQGEDVHAEEHARGEILQESRHEAQKSTAARPVKEAPRNGQNQHEVHRNAVPGKYGEK